MRFIKGAFAFDLPQVEREQGLRPKHLLGGNPRFPPKDVPPLAGLSPPSSKEGMRKRELSPYRLLFQKKSRNPMQNMRGVLCLGICYKISGGYHEKKIKIRCTRKKNGKAIRSVNNFKRNFGDFQSRSKRHPSAGNKEGRWVRNASNNKVVETNQKNTQKVKMH
jgi:hypothetical protein